MTLQDLSRDQYYKYDTFKNEQERIEKKSNKRNIIAISKWLTILYIKNFNLVSSYENNYSNISRFFRLIHRNESDCSLLEPVLQQILIRRYYSKKNSCLYTEYDIYLITMYIIQVMLYDEPLSKILWIKVGIRENKYNAFIYNVFSFLSIIDYNLSFDIYIDTNDREYILDIYKKRIELIN